MWQCLTHKTKRQTFWGCVQEATKIQEANTTAEINCWLTALTKADILAKGAIQIKMVPLANTSTY